MSKFIVVVFPNRDLAHQGRDALMRLHSDRLIRVYASALISIDAEGNVIDQEIDGKGPRGAVLGGSLGGLIGLIIGGPLIATLGAASGAILGGWRDVLDLDVGLDFIEEIRLRMKPGDSALLAEIEEDRMEPLDTAMDAFGGIVIRGRRDDLEEERIQRELESRRADLKQYEEELKQATTQTRAHLASRVDEARERLRGVSDSVEKRLRRLEVEADAKIEALRDHAPSVPPDPEMEKEIAELRARFERRLSRLKQAHESAKEALGE